MSAPSLTSPATGPRKSAPKPVPPPDRRFYANSRAFGRLGIRWFNPVTMLEAHSHGHIEMNWLTAGGMDYLFDGRPVHVPPDQLVMFWAGVSHRTTAVDRGAGGDSRQCNVYLPLDAFLHMPKLDRLRETLMAGGVIALRPETVSIETLGRWYDDYRSGNSERAEILKLEISAFFRRATFFGWDELLPPWHAGKGSDHASATQTRYVVAMVRHVIENLTEPLTTSEVAEVVGLHPNYALNLFSRIMRVPLRKFIVRMRLVRARALLAETDLPVSSIGFAAGFSSISQFYQQFQSAYGITPLRMRESYLRMVPGIETADLVTRYQAAS